jgi:hypothetical protein
LNQEADPSVPEIVLPRTGYWQRVASNRAIVIFEAGRALNRVRFHSVQVRVTLNRGHRFEAEVATQDLGRLARFLRSTAETRDAIQKEVTDTISEWLKMTHEEFPVVTQ